MNKRYSVEEVEFIKKQRGRISIKEMAEELGRSCAGIQCKICKLGLTIGKRVGPPNTNISFFEEWSQELAYIVGFFLADGHMANYHREGHYGIRFSITDKDVIEKIVKVCGYKNSIKKYTQRSSVLYNISISSRFVWEFFESLGFTHNKTFTTRIPKQIPQELMHHFIRGVFDGDGSVCFGRKHYPKATITGSELFIDDVSKLCVEHSGIYRYNRSFTIRYSGQKAIDFLNYIYKNSTIHMDRKYKRYLKALKWKNSCNPWTEQEIELLKGIGPINNIDDLINIFNRSRQSIRTKAYRLHIKIKSKTAIQWADQEISLLKNLAPATYIDNLVNIFNRSFDGIRTKASRLNIKIKKRRRKPWSNSEIRLLKETYLSSTDNEIVNAFNRSLNSIRKKIHKLGIKKYKKEKA